MVFSFGGGEGVGREFKALLKNPHLNPGPWRFVFGVGQGGERAHVCVCVCAVAAGENIIWWGLRAVAGPAQARGEGACNGGTGCSAVAAEHGSGTKQRQVLQDGSAVVLLLLLAAAKLVWGRLRPISPSLPMPMHERVHVCFTKDRTGERQGSEERCF